MLLYYDRTTDTAIKNRILFYLIMPSFISIRNHRYTESDAIKTKKGALVISADLLLPLVATFPVT